MKLNSETLQRVIEIARLGGEAALKHYHENIEVEYKADNSPLTLADQAAHEVIVAELASWTPDIPVLSEESNEDEFRDRKSWPTFWVVDPLDGSKEFIKRSGQFTVNIALVDGHESVLGVVYVPVTEVVYCGLKGEEPTAWMRNGEGKKRELRCRSADIDHLMVVASRDHAGPRVKAFLGAEALGGAEVTSMGSSLKFCLVADGKADFYPRVVPTMEWDTAAAQCIVEVAGGSVTTLEGERLTYNKDDLRNPSLLTFGDASIPWHRFFAENSLEEV